MYIIARGICLGLEGGGGYISTFKGYNYVFGDT